MGGFVLFKSGCIKDDTKIQAIFEKRGFSTPINIQFGDNTLLVYPKILQMNHLIIKHGNAAIVVTGTMVYRGKSCSDSARELLQDFIGETINEDELLGHFVCFIYRNGLLNMITDKLSTLAVYYHYNLPVISSSFLALSEACERSLTVSKQAVLEIILAQGVLPPDTQVDEIKRYIPSLRCCRYPGLVMYTYKQHAESVGLISTFDDVVNDQISRLDDYFNYVKPALLEYGVMMGLTGGFDSRLLLAMLLRHGIMPMVYTHWQHGDSMDFKLASELAGLKNLDLNFLPEHELETDSKTDGHLPGFLYTDAQCRHQYFWSEVYNSPDYYNRLNINAGIGLNGVGGEQYRNYEGLSRKNCDLRTWLRNEIYPFARSVLPKSEFNTFEDRYVDKVKQILDLDDSIDALGIKKYYNLVYGYSNRYYRAIFENQVLFHFSPFSDAFNSLYAYRAIPYLGKSFGFQSAMLRKIAPDLARVNSSYGFPFSDNPPLGFRAQIALRNIIPKRRIRQLKLILGKPQIQGGLLPVSPELRESIGPVNWGKLPPSFENKEMLTQISYFMAYLQRDRK